MFFIKNLVPALCVGLQKIVPIPLLRSELKAFKSKIFGRCPKIMRRRKGSKNCKTADTATKGDFVATFVSLGPLEDLKKSKSQEKHLYFC